MFNCVKAAVSPDILQKCVSKPRLSADYQVVYLYKGHAPVRQLSGLSTIHLHPKTSPPSDIWVKRDICINQSKSPQVKLDVSVNVCSHCRFLFPKHIHYLRHNAPTPVLSSCGGYGLTSLHRQLSFSLLSGSCFPFPSSPQPRQTSTHCWARYTLPPPCHSISERRDPQHRSEARIHDRSVRSASSQT